MGKKKGRKMPAWRRIARAGVGLVGAGFGIFIASSPLHRSLQFAFKGEGQNAANAAIYDTTGATLEGGAPRIDAIVRTGAIVGLGLGVITLFRYLARRI